MRIKIVRIRKTYRASDT